MCQEYYLGDLLGKNYRIPLNTSLHQEPADVLATALGASQNDSESWPSNFLCRVFNLSELQLLQLEYAPALSPARGAVRDFTQHRPGCSRVRGVAVTLTS